MKTILALLFLVLALPSYGFNLRAKYVGTTNTPNLLLRWQGSYNYFGYQYWDVSGGNDIYSPNETRDSLGISDSTLDATIGNTFTLRYSIGGTGPWVDCSAPVTIARGGDTGYMLWTMGGAPATPNTYSTTNTSSDPRVFQYQDGNGTTVVTLQPGESLTVSSTNAFTLSEITAVTTGTGEFTAWKYTTNQLASYGAGSSGTAYTVTPPPQATVMSPTNTPVFNAPANDAQKAANATVNEIRNASDAQKDAMGSLLAELKKLNAKDLATNSTGSSSYSNSAYAGWITSANTSSNAIFASNAQASNDIKTVIAFMNDLAESSPGSMTVQLGQSSYTVNPMSGTILADALAFSRNAILYVAKLILIYALFRQMLHCWKGMSMAASGTSTSGWLQAAFVSMPQIVSSMAGLTGRWLIVAFAVGAVAAFGAGAMLAWGPSVTLAGIAGGSAVAARGWTWVTAMVPVDGLFSAFTLWIVSTVAMYAMTMGAMAASDASGKL